MAPAQPRPASAEEKLTASVRVNLLPAEYAQLQAVADERGATVAGFVRRAVRDLLQLHEDRIGHTVHGAHPDIHTNGLADQCLRCDQHAVDPFASLDEDVLRALALRLRDGEPARSDNERRAMDVLHRAMRDSEFVHRLVTS